ncbi:GMC family oxidoreductase [Acanthopleuribacter pedis]|uniref:GMC family oxidoreductase n=1 Tax=Acanthopleuribacter pedis TaxID=442870 RepID=A0A8J7U400_9BACT|nr:GMC family oxidoreductase [Acanthopleuribacter pedis]MBO1320132.1 GMC family oxidoreductase [Acanthopleuribacter pedis]
MIPDPIAEGLANGWSAVDASGLSENKTLETDVVIVGTGAGGGMCAEVLCAAGFKVVLIEEGPLRSSRDFTMRESFAYPELYQESASRKTKDKAINILQGRCVGGGTTVNWTSSFETPPPTLAHWQKHHDVAGCDEAAMKPWFDKAFARLGIHQWPVPPNPNNAALQRGAEQLGLSFEIMQRNVRGCANLGYCGMGCPINAKQSMLITTIPAALDSGAALYSRTRAVRLMFSGDRVQGVVCAALDERGVFPTGVQIEVRAKAVVLAGGAIGTPALLLRSGTPDPYQLAGKRTFLHPVTAATAFFEEEIRPFEGAPQSIYSDEYLWPEGADGPMGFKLEVPPLHPVISATVLDFPGSAHHTAMARLAHIQGMLALCRDGFHPDSPGGQVNLRTDGSPLLDYPFTDFLRDGFRRSLKAMVEIQFAAGAKEVVPLHRHSQPYKTWAEAKKALDALPMDPTMVRLFSAHVMGGCPLGEDPRQALVNSEGRHHHLQHLWVMDGSVFPTSIGSNPQVSIYGMTLKNAEALVKSLKS